MGPRAVPRATPSLRAYNLLLERGSARVGRVKNNNKLQTVFPRAALKTLELELHYITFCPVGWQQSYHTHQDLRLIFNYNHPHNISGPVEYIPLALLVIGRDGGRSEKLGVHKSNKRAKSAPHPRHM